MIKGEPPRPRNDVEVPPAVSSLGYLLEEEELYKQGFVSFYLAQLIQNPFLGSYSLILSIFLSFRLWKGGRKGTDRTRWLNSPNVYQKIEIQETGTPDPKKITKVEIITSNFF